MGKNRQSNKDINIILESQRMKLFLTQNISAFTLGSGMINKKLDLRSKKMYVVFFFIFFFIYLYIYFFCFCFCFFFLFFAFCFAFLVFDYFFYLVVSYLFCFKFCFCTEYWLAPGLIVPIFGTVMKLQGNSPTFPDQYFHSGILNREINCVFTY